MDGSNEAAKNSCIEEIHHDKINFRFSLVKSKHRTISIVRLNENGPLPEMRRNIFFGYLKLYYNRHIRRYQNNRL